MNKKDERLEMPDECDRCGESVMLTRYERHAPCDEVKWLCCYCERSFDDKHLISRGIAAMLHEFERRNFNKK